VRGPREERNHVVSQKARTRGDRVAIAEAMLLGSEKLEGLDQVETFFGTGHRDIEEATFFFDLCWLSGRHVRGDTTIDKVQHIHCPPFLTLGRMDCR
jgi:hypothetical protein